MLHEIVVEDQVVERMMKINSVGENEILWKRGRH